MGLLRKSFTPGYKPFRKTALLWHQGFLYLAMVYIQILRFRENLVNGGIQYR